jgi:purine-binding chemotaxis protein CheW
MLDLLFFVCDDIRYAVAADDVESIVWLPGLSPLDAAPNWCAGHLNWHGTPVPVVDFGRLLGHPKRHRTLNDQLIIIRAEGQPAAILVSRVDQLATLEETQIAATVQPSQPEAPPFRAEIRDGDQLVMLVDSSALLRRLAEIGSRHPDETTIGLPTSPAEEPLSEEVAQQFLERTHQLAASRLEEKTTLRINFALVDIGNRSYAIPLTQVAEFSHLQHYAPLPGLPDFIVGCMNLRGEIITIVDLDRFLKHHQPAKGDGVVVLEGDGKRLGVRINGIERMIAADQEAIQSIGGADGQQPLARQLLHLPDSVAAILDVEALLKGELLDVFEQA